MGSVRGVKKRQAVCLGGKPNRKRQSEGRVRRRKPGGAGGKEKSSNETKLLAPLCGGGTLFLLVKKATRKTAEGKNLCSFTKV